MNPALTGPITLASDGATPSQLNTRTRSTGSRASMPAVRWILFERFTDGLYQVEKVRLYVNRGIGNVGTAIRLNASPEVSLLTLRSGAVVAGRET